MRISLKHANKLCRQLSDISENKVDYSTPFRDTCSLLLVELLEQCIACAQHDEAQEIRIEIEP